MYVNALLTGRKKVMDKKIGILALGRAENYGAVLQSYSLCRFLRQEMNLDCKVIDYSPKFIIGRYPLFNVNKTSLYKLLKSSAGSIIKFPVKLLKRIRFEKFRKEYCYFTEKKYLKVIEDEFDEYIVGSDQVFNLELTNFETEFFLPNIDKSKNAIAFAASLGKSYFSEEEIEFYSKYVKRFNYLSIREVEGARFIKTLVKNKEVYQHIDPVFLTKKEEWEKLLKKPIYKKPYILIYTFKSFDLAYELSKKLDIDVDIVCINDNVGRPHKNVINIRGVGPLEFLSLVHNAEFVVTDSFHGTAFSIIFEKKFIVIPYEETESRFYSMLECLKLLKEGYVSKKEYLELIDVDYKLVKKMIDKNVINSFNYLNDALQCL